MKYFNANDHSRQLPAFIKQIPEDASLSAQDTILPHLSHREYIYKFPSTKNADYIILDSSASIWPMGSDSYIRKISDLLDTEFGVLDTEGPMLLLKRQSPPAKDSIPGEFLSGIATH